LSIKYDLLALRIASTILGSYDGINGSIATLTTGSDQYFNGDMIWTFDVLLACTIVAVLLTA